MTINFIQDQALKSILNIINASSKEDAVYKVDKILTSIQDIAMVAVENVDVKSQFSNIANDTQLRKVA